MWFLQFFFNLGFKHQNLKEENLEDNVIIHGSNLRRLKIQTLPERTGKRAGSREVGVTLQLESFVCSSDWEASSKKRNRRFCKYHGGKILKEEG